MTLQVPLLVPVCFCILPVCSHVLKLQCRPAGGVSADISMLLHVSQVADVSLQLLGGGVGSDVQTLMGVQGEAACLLQTSTSSRRRRRCRCADHRHRVILAPYCCLLRVRSLRLTILWRQLSSLPPTEHKLPAWGLHQQPDLLEHCPPGECLLSAGWTI